VTLALVSKTPNGWAGKLMTEVHNGLDQGEVERVRAEHPGEGGAIMGYRVLNTIMVTRGTPVGDFA
jgi:pyruvate dehydrogenase phosphatase